MISESNLNRYRLFCAVAECESISRAAEINYISQPAISKAITRMEESLNTTLFIRNHRGVTLTEEGRILYEQLKTAFDIIKAGEEKLYRINELGIGHLKLGTSGVLCRHMLIPYLKDYIKNNPHVKISIEVQSSSKIHKILADGRIDVALMVKPDNTNGLCFFSLGEIEDIFTATPKYIENLSSKNQKDFFEEANIMLLDGENISRMHIDRYFRENGISPRHILEVSGMDMLIEFAKIGMGAACVIKQFVEEELDKNVLRQIMLDVPVNKREVGFAYMKNAGLTMAMKNFKEVFDG